MLAKQALPQFVRPISVAADGEDGYVSIPACPRCRRSKAAYYHGDRHPVRGELVEGASCFACLSSEERDLLVG